MFEDPRNIQRATWLTWVAHNLERIGDRATNIAERVIYLTTGQTPAPDERWPDVGDPTPTTPPPPPPTAPPPPNRHPPLVPRNTFQPLPLPSRCRLASKCRPSGNACRYLPAFQRPS